MRHLSDANALNLKSEAFAKRPERQKRDWSFLSWAFFLPHLVATEVFFGKGAKAADQDGPHKEVASDSAANTAPSSDSPLDPISAKGADDFHARQGDGSAASSNQTVLSDLKTDTQYLWTLRAQPSARMMRQRRRPEVAAGAVSVSFHGSTFTDGTVSARSGDEQPNSNNVHAAITPDQLAENPLSPSITGSDESPEGPRNGFNPTGSSESEGPHGVGASPVSTSTGPGYGPGFLGDAQVGLATGVHLPDSTTAPAPDISPGLGAAIDVKGLLGFDLQLNGDGLGAELGTGSLSDLLGFDLHVTADGIFAGLNPGASLLIPIVTGVAEGVENVLHTTASELGSMLSLDGQLGSALLPGLLGDSSGLPIMGGETPSQPLKDLLADVTGVQVLGGLESVTIA